jgi:hypothetical protein
MLRPVLSTKSHAVRSSLFRSIAIDFSRKGTKKIPDIHADARDFL